MKFDFKKAAKSRKTWALSLAAMGSLCLHSSVLKHELPTNTTEMSQRSHDNVGIELPATVPDKSRGLSVEEKKYLKTLFRGALDTDDIYVLRYPEMPEYINDPAFWQKNNRIIIVTPENYSENYARDDNIDRYSHFIAWAATFVENAKIEQPDDQIKLPPQSTGQWDDKENTRLRSLSPLERVEAITAYAKRFLHISHNGIGSCVVDEKLMGAIESDLPGARSLRLTMPEKPWEFLTTEEVSLAYGIFGDALDTGRMRKVFSSRNCEEHSATVSNADEITFNGGIVYSPNYAMESNRDLFGLFVHEITHNYQIQRAQNSSDVPEYKDKYQYDLEQVKQFWSYTAEQQAEIIRDYALSFLHIRRSDYDSGQDKELLKTVVETAFPQASITREFFDNHGFLPTPEQSRHFQSIRQELATPDKVEFQLKF